MCLHGPTLPALAGDAMQDRYRKLSNLLKQRLEPAERGDMAAMRAAAEADAERLVVVPFGAPMLHLIACAPRRMLCSGFGGSACCVCNPATWAGSAPLPMLARSSNS